MNLYYGDSFTISVLVWGVDGGNSKIRWRERGSGFELAGDLKRFSFPCGMLLFQLLLLLSFVVFRSTSGSTSFLELLFLTIRGSRYISIVVVVVVGVVAGCRFALRVFLFARFP